MHSQVEHPFGPKPWAYVGWMIVREEQYQIEQGKI